MSHRRFNPHGLLLMGLLIGATIAALLLAGCGTTTKQHSYTAQQVVAAASLVSVGGQSLINSTSSDAQQIDKVANQIIPGLNTKLNNATAAASVSILRDFTGTHGGDTAEITVITTKGDKVIDGFYHFVKINGRWQPKR